jgi:hypothetical protein
MFWAQHFPELLAKTIPILLDFSGRPLPCQYRLVANLHSWGDNLRNLLPWIPWNYSLFKNSAKNHHSTTTCMLPRCWDEVLKIWSYLQQDWTSQGLYWPFILLVKIIVGLRQLSNKVYVTGIIFHPQDSYLSYFAYLPSTLSSGISMTVVFGSSRTTPLPICASMAPLSACIRHGIVFVLLSEYLWHVAWTLWSFVRNSFLNSSYSSSHFLGIKPQRFPLQNWLYL